MNESRKVTEGLKQAVAYAGGRGTTKAVVRQVTVPQRVDVRAIRAKLGLSQREFALRFGFTLGSVRNWEQGHRGPEGSARILLTIVDYGPEFVEEALRAATG
jgi:putative transcriptional regulator